MKSAHESKDINSINSALESINNAWHAASEDMAKAAQQQGPSQNGGQTGGNSAGSNSGNGSNGNNDPGTVDVDYEEVK